LQLDAEYDEMLRLAVTKFSNSCPDQKVVVYKIEGKKKYNSWFSFDLNNDTFFYLPKGSTFTVSVYCKPFAVYQSFNNDEVEEALRAAKQGSPVEKISFGNEALPENFPGNPQASCILKRLKYVQIF